MGMSPPVISGQVPNLNRTPSTHVQRLGRSSSTTGAVIPEDSGLNKRVPGMQTGCEPTVVRRKKLPWLEPNRSFKPGHLPGAFDSKESLELHAMVNLESSPAAGTASDVPIVGAVAAEDVLATKRPSTISLAADPSLKAIGSTPPLRKSKSAERPRTLSLTSELRPGVKGAISKQQARRALGIVGERQAHDEDYTPSEYSTTISSDGDDVSAVLERRKDSVAYDLRVKRAAARKESTHGPLTVSQGWLKSNLDLPLNASNVGLTSSSRRAISVPTVPAQPPLDPTRNSIASPLTAVKRSGTTTSKLVLARKETLHPMPSHLMGSSSGSSRDIPSHVLSSTDASSASSPMGLSPRSALKYPGLNTAVTISQSPDVSPGAATKPAIPAATAARGLRRETRDLNRAVTGLENLMEEALIVAKDAAQSGWRDDVAHILDSATIALRKASTAIQPKRAMTGRGRISEPLPLSPHESGGSSVSDSEDVSPSAHSSVQHSRGASVETAPTLFTNSAQSSLQPLRMETYTRNGKAPTSETAALDCAVSSTEDSISRTPPRLYQPPSADSIVRDFAYTKKLSNAQKASLSAAAGYGAAADFYNDHGESVSFQPGIRRSIALQKMPEFNQSLPDAPSAALNPGRDTMSRTKRGTDEVVSIPTQRRRFTKSELRELDHIPTDTVPPPANRDITAPAPDSVPQRRRKPGHQPHISDFFESAFYHHPVADPAVEQTRRMSTTTDTRSVDPAPSAAVVPPPPSSSFSSPPLQRAVTTKSARKHISLREGQGFSLGRYHRRQPIAREWNPLRKRITATIACSNTVFIGLIAGIYAGEVPRMQYYIADTSHKVILGNVLLFAGLGLTTLIFWPLPLLHGRKPYTLMAFALMLPLQFPQALAVSTYRDPSRPLFLCGLLIPRIFTGMALGFANINQLPTLFDLFGCSLMSERPHQEIVTVEDVRRQGDGVGIWLGIWAWCFVGSLSIGFCIGACIISTMDPSWGFYIIVMLLAFFLLVNVVAPETRRAPYRRSIAHFFDDDDKLRRRVARGEVKLHISNDGPKWWFQEVWAGVVLTKRMVMQPGFFVLMVYIAWIYAQVTLVILLLGALLSRDYHWQPQYVGLASLSLAIGALLAVPLAKASVFSRARFTPQRTDSMTMRAPRLTWSSHLMRRCIFTLLLPFAGLAYTLSAPGPQLNWTSPTIFCGLVGFLSCLAIAECVGLIMEVFDTCDLQPGVNQKHRLQSMAETTRRRRTNYSSFPRVCAGFFAVQALGFFLAAASTGVSGAITRALGAQKAVAVVAGILLLITLLFMLVMWRRTEVQVIPNSVFGTTTTATTTATTTKQGGIAWGPGADDPEWKPVVIGHPSGKMRRINLLEMGNLTRWTEIRRLNRLIRS